MKKSLLWLVVLVVSATLVASFVLSGCKKEAAPAEEEEAEEAPAEEEVAVEEAAEEIVLNMWWWGEEEKPGLKDWLAETVGLYEEANPNVKVETVLQSVDTVQSAFRTAGAAKDPVVGPDIQFFWPGIWLMIDVWNGLVEPVDGLFPQEFLDELNISKEVKYDGKIWAVPWYTLNWPIVYNKQMFADSGLDPENPPRTWEEFTDACEKLKASGYTPWGVGTKDGYFMNWWLNNFGLQGFDNHGDLMDVYVEGDVDDPRIREIFEPLHELYSKGYCNDNATSLSIYEGNELFKSKDCAMTLCVFPDWIRDMGDEVVGVMLPPIYGNGYMADKCVAVTSQTYAISSWSEHKDEAADFIMFMMSKERTLPMYEASHAIHARKDFDPNILETQMERDLYGWIQSNPDNGSAENFFPEKVVYEGLNPAAQLIFSDNYTVDQCIEFVKSVVDEWRAISPEEVENFAGWSESFK